MACALRYNFNSMNGSEQGQLARQESSGWLRWTMVVALLGAWALRLIALAQQDIWWDEARNIDVALRPFWSIPTAPELDIHPPVYFWLLHGWSRLLELGRGLEPAQLAYGMRLFSVFAGVIGVALVYRLGRLAAVRGAGVAAAVLAAASPFWLAESQETRMYTLGFALLAAAAVAFWHSGREGVPTLVPPAASAVPSSAGRRIRWGAVATFVVLSAAALATHYNAVFILVAWYLWWGGVVLVMPAHTGEPVVWGARLRNLGLVFGCGLATVALLLPVVPIALRQIPGYANPNLTVPTLAGYLTENWRAYLGGYAFSAEWAGGRSSFWLWSVLALGAVGLVLVTLRRGAARLPLSFLLMWLVGGLALYYVAVLDRNAFNVRYASFITPALYALLGAAVAGWSLWVRPMGLVALLMVVALWPQAVRADLTDPAFAREDISGVTAWLRNQVQAGDVIFVDQKYPFGFYYDRYAIDPAVTPVGDEVAPARYLFVDINTIDRRLDEWASDAKRVFWVQWFESDTDPRRAVSFLLDQAGTRQGEEWFQGYSIDWWQLNPPNEFVLAPNLTPVVHGFPPAVQTVAASLPHGPVAQGGNVPVVVRWQRIAGGTVDRSLKARVALYAPDGGRVAQRDERLLNDRHLLPAEWDPADRPLNVYLLEVPEDAAPGMYTIGLLVYDADTLEPLGAVDVAGNPNGIEPILGSVEVVTR